jgi:hypothetical protein
MSTHHEKILWEDGYWIQCFRVLEASASTRAKPMKRLLMALISELTKRTTSGGNISDALSTITAPLRSQDQHGKMKPALQALDGIISRKIVSVVDIARALSVDLGAGGDQLSEIYQTLFSKLFELATHPELTQTAGRAISRLWTRIRSELHTPDGMFDGLALPLIWISPLVRVLADCPESIPRFKSHVFPELFLINLADFKILLKSLGFYSIFPRNLEPPTRIKTFDVGIRRTILFSIVDAGKHIGFVGDDGTKFKQHKYLLTRRRRRHKRARRESPKNYTRCRMPPEPHD